MVPLRQSNSRFISNSTPGGLATQALRRGGSRDEGREAAGFVDEFAVDGIFDRARKVSVAIGEWKGRKTSGFRARKLTVAGHGDGWPVARRARKENLRSMEQCLRAKAGKHRLLARALFHDCSLAPSRGQLHHGAHRAAVGRNKNEQEATEETE